MLTCTPWPCRKAAKSRPQLPVASMQACFWGIWITALFGEPGEQLRKAGLGVGERGVADTLAHEKGRVELGFADVDADDGHGASELVAWLRPCQPHL